VKKLLVAIPVSTILVLLLIPLITSPALAQLWSEGPPMPTARSEITATNIGNDIYVIGGFDESGDPLDVVEVYNVKNNSWKSIDPLPQEVHHPAAASYDGKIYVVGGFISRELIPSNQLFIYDPMNNQWTKGKSMPTPRGALNALFVNGTLYAIGGRDGSGTLNINEAYDPLTNKWISKTSMPTARHHAASATVDNKIYVVGGRTVGSSSLVNINVNEMYDTETEKWTAVGSMPSKRSGIAAAAVNNSFFVFGGEDLTRTYDNNEEYDTEDGKWTSQEPMPTSRHGLAAVSVGERIFVIGGGPKPGLSVCDVNEIYKISPKTALTNVSNNTSVPANTSYNSRIIGNITTSNAALNLSVPTNRDNDTILSTENETHWSAQLRLNATYIEGSFRIIEDKNETSKEMHAGLVWQEGNNKTYYAFVRPGLGLIVLADSVGEISCATLIAENVNSNKIKIINSPESIYVYHNGFLKIKVPREFNGTEISPVGIRTYNTKAEFDTVKIGTFPQNLSRFLLPKVNLMVNENNSISIKTMGDSLN
jgi:N-acetylneuraminic acid mutarotase